MAIQVDVVARIPKDDKEAKVVLNQPATVEEAIELWGGDSVLNHATANVRVTLQGIIRRLMDASKTQEEITELTADWKPGVTIEGVGANPADRILKNFDKMTAEEKQKILEQLMAKSTEEGQG